MSKISFFLSNYTYRNRVGTAVNKIGDGIDGTDAAPNRTFSTNIERTDILPGLERIDFLQERSL